MLVAVAGVLALILIIAAIGLANVQAVPIIRRASVKLPGLTAGSSPIQVALLSDIHLGNRGMEQGRLANIVDQVTAARPDLILIAGDFVTGHDAEGIEARAAGLTAPLSRLRAPLGVFAVLGNHDHWTSPAAVRSALQKAGIIILENQAERRGPLAIIGIGDRFSGHDDIARSIAAARRVGGAPIIVTHSPDIASTLPAGFPLVLAGHTHCGQLVLPWIGPLLTRAPRDHWRPLYTLRYRCGLISDPGRLTVVTAGLGSGSAPIRLGAMPDWWLLTLHS
ncbi:metallophosphoesterase [Sphingomonas sp.]|uniref:metallophosphoesterase n=1 Tax=Sphingomonas sp. TaxID=28214 RepID=UPI003D6D4CF3